MKMATWIKLFSAVIISFNLCHCKKAEEGKEKWNYPPLEKSLVREVHFGDTIVDEYRNLEKLNDPTTQKWLKEQRAFYKKIISSISNIDTLEKELEFNNNLSSSRVDVPRASGERIFYKERIVKSNQQRLLYKNGLDGKPVELFETQNKDFNIDYFEPSFNGKSLAIGISKGGDELSTILVLDVEKNILLKDSIPMAMFGNPQWLPDNSGFFYNQLKADDSGEDQIAMFEDSKVKLHLLGEEAIHDKEVFSRELSKGLRLAKIDVPVFYTHPLSDKVIAVVYSGSNPYVSIFYIDLLDLLNDKALKKGWKKVISQEERIDHFTFTKSHLYVISRKSNSNGALKQLSLNDEHSGKTVVSEKDIVLEGMMQAKDGLYLKTLNKGINELMKIDLDDLNISKIKTPFPGTIELSPSFSIPSIYLHHEGLLCLLGSWNKEWQVFLYQPEKQKFINTQLRPTAFEERLSKLAFKEVEVEAHDGARIPLSIIYDNDTPSESQPLILYGYGAYGSNITPYFDPSLITWLTRGGIFAVAHVRGGGEKGYDWHMGGYKETKPNSWKDFITCAEYLINNGYTSPGKLAAEGESAGGITIGRAIIERPDLFKAAVISVGALNPLRDETTSNTLSTAEFGTVKDSLEFRYLLEMDVYHQIEENIRYPSILLNAGINDPRVAAWQSAKVAAKMQEANGENLVLLNLSDEGHISYSPETEKYAFLLWQLGHPDFKKE